MEFTGERYVPSEQGQIRLEHVHRYAVAASLCENRDVLDLASGEGYGSSMLAEKAKSVVGVDISEESVRHAKKVYGRHENLRFTVNNMTALEFPDKSFDVVVCLEAIEHICKESQELTIKEIDRVLRPDGLLVISNPNRIIYDSMSSPNNPFHLHEMDLEELDILLKSKFSYVRYFAQQLGTGSLMSPLHDPADGFTLWQDDGVRCNRGMEFPIPHPYYFIAVCSHDEQFVTISASSALYAKNIDLYHEIQLGARRSFNELNERTDLLHQKIKLLDDKEKSLATANAKVAEYYALMMDHENSLAKQGEILKEKDEQLINLNTKLNGQKNKIAAIEAGIADLYSAINTRDNEIAALSQKLEKTEAEIISKDVDLKNITAANNQAITVLKSVLNAKEHELFAITSSRSWRLTRIFQKLSATIIPPASKRRLLAKTLFLLVKYPSRFVKSLTYSRFKAFFRTLRKEGPTAVAQRLDRILRPHGGQEHAFEVRPIRKNDGGEGAKSYSELVFPVFPNPRVTIVVPVYNEYNFTIECLSSILRNSGDVSYEVIIADDCSTDNTKEIKKNVKNITVIRNQMNLQFLKNCNNATKKARGDYILFLNNDTQVQKGWLQPLLDLMARDSRIGLVGSQLIYPDGSLQEAGGIYWRDGSAWNFGNGQNPKNADFNYAREVDYVSGASMMIRRSLWQEIGGFDERFAPAYCEDADLAFQVREKGFKVVYQPESVVVHFEGVSHGTDLESGIKRHQVINQAKFRDKWNDCLEQDHFPNGEEVFLARGRGRNKKQLLMIDHYVPQFDQDAGSRCVFQYIQMFRNQNFDVTFIPDNFHYDERYVKELQQLGVFVLYGSDYGSNWLEWLKVHGKYFNYIFLNRPHISIKYIDHVREFSNAKILYFGHDLHYLRCQREFEITGKKETKTLMIEMEKVETELIRKADISFYPSSYEVNFLLSKEKDLDCRVLPLNIFPDIPTRNFSKDSTGLLFVGGFRHTPNVDGMLWFVNEIMPLIKKRRKDLKLTVIGSNPPKEIQALSSTDIIIKGYVTDDELGEAYKNHRLCIIPLRYGAGVKGKVIESMYYGLPLVTTTIGAEGLDGIESFAEIADNARDFASAILNIYDDFDLLSEKSQRGVAFVQENFSEDRVCEKISTAFDLNLKRDGTEK